ncbi:ABC transporter ATP-binding protein [Chelatococcus reniformis]|uniref:ABC transporter ATP-binding protein n=1 Tax=Chelatococcus reniformis TaxID=1494448 RepID=A0A916UQC6_9HYPH|nr:ABC transporter ATP-binding protein [Chelatococcus reniformis]GGC83164.1 ABC transporter ATP-binding protein [Chelatococcus reniformis]
MASALATPILAVDNVGRRFGGLKAVDGVSFTVAPGEILGIIGPNGAGKTTLFNLMSGFLAPSGGNIRFKGRSIVGVRPDRVVAMGLARSFQIVQVFAGMSVLDVVTTGALLRHPMRIAVDKAEAVLVRVGLAGKATATPDTLSLQDKKLLELAKCLATEPELILLDEVMAGLTLGEAQVPLAIIRELRGQGLTFVMVEHVMPVIMACADRIVVLNFGEKVAEGSPQEIIADPRVKDAYFGDEPHE